MLCDLTDLHRSVPASILCRSAGHGHSLTATGSGAAERRTRIATVLTIRLTCASGCGAHCKLSRLAVGRAGDIYAICCFTDCIGSAVRCVADRSADTVRFSHGCAVCTGSICLAVGRTGHVVTVCRFTDCIGSAVRCVAGRSAGHGHSSAVGRSAGFICAGAASCKYPAAVGHMLTHQQACQCAFATPGASHDGGHAFRRQSHVAPVQHQPAAALVAEADVLETDIALREILQRTFALLLDIHQSEYLVSRRIAVHGDMEKGPQHPQRQEELRRDQQHEKALHEADIAFCIFQYAQGDPHCRSAVSHHVHDADGVELHDEHAHGYLPELFGILVHPAGVFPVGTVYLQRREPLETFQEAVAKMRVAAPVFPQQPFRYLLYHDDGRRYQRQTDQQHQRHFQTYSGCYREKCQRRRHAVEELRHILAHVKFQLFRTFCADLHYFGSGYLLMIAAAEPQQLAEYHGAQPRFYTVGDTHAEAASSCGGYETHRQEHCCQHKVCHCVVACHCTEYHVLHHRGAGKDEQDVGDHAEPLAYHDPRRIFSCICKLLQEPFMKHSFLLFLPAANDDSPRCPGASSLRRLRLRGCVRVPCLPGRGHSLLYRSRRNICCLRTAASPDHLTG